MEMMEKSPGEIQREKEDNEALDTEVNVDGHKLKLRDMFSDAYQARDFKLKLKLLRSKAGGEPDQGPTKEDLENMMFKGEQKDGQ